MKQTKNNSTEHLTLNTIYNEDCMVGLNRIPDNSVDLVLTDIPYGEVNRANSGIRNLDKGNADIVNFDLVELTQTLCNKTKGSIYMFCGFEQVSDIIKTMREEGLITRIITWEKTNPSPMNGQNLWLSASELCVFGKKRGATFNGHCMSNVLHYPTQRGKIHPTMKPVKLFEELITTSSNEDDIVLDAFMGSGTTAIACMNTNRRYVGFELNKEFYDRANERIKNHVVHNYKEEKSNMKHTNTLLDKECFAEANDILWEDTVSFETTKDTNKKNSMAKTKKNIIQQIAADFDGVAFTKEMHTIYKNFGGITARHIGKGFAKYVAEEMGIDWYQVVVILNKLLESHSSKDYQIAKNNINWEAVCQKHCSKMLVLTKTKTAYKHLFYLMAESNCWNADSILAEHILNAYGWDKIARTLVFLYENLYVRASFADEVEDAEVIEEAKDESVEVMEEEPTEIVETEPIAVETVADSLETIGRLPSIEDLISEPILGDVVPVVATSTTPSTRYKRGRMVKVTYLDDGSFVIYKSATLAEKGTGICHGSANKCLNANPAYKTLTDKKNGCKCSMTYCEAA